MLASVDVPAPKCQRTVPTDPFPDPAATNRTGDAARGSPETLVVRHAVLPLRLSLGFIWLFTGLICIPGTEDGLALTERVGIHGAAATWIIRLTSGFEITGRLS